MNLRIMLTMCVMVIAGFLSGGCQKPVTATDLTGTWVEKKTSQQKWIKTATTCQIALNADGTFVASVPDYMMTTFDKAAGQVMTGKGQWNLEPPKTLAPREIKLNFNEVNGEQGHWGGRELQVQRVKQGFELFFYVGEEGGERFVFERVSTEKEAQK